MLSILQIQSQAADLRLLRNHEKTSGPSKRNHSVRQDDVIFHISQNEVWALASSSDRIEHVPKIGQRTFLLRQSLFPKSFRMTCVRCWVAKISICKLSEDVASAHIWIRITVVEYTQASRSNLCLFWRQNFHGFLLQDICRTNVTWNNYVSCVFAFCCSRSDLKTTLSLFYLIWRSQKGCVVFLCT